MIVRSRASSLL